MARFIEMDELVTISELMEEDIDPIHINPVDVDEFPKRWAADDTAFKQQPRFISAQLHRGIAGSGTIINYAIWESTEHLKRAVNNVGVQARLSEY